MMPALLTRRCSGPSPAAASPAARTDPRSDRSTTSASVEAAGTSAGDRLGRRGELVGRTPREHDPGAVAGELERGVEAEPAERRPGDDGGATGQVADVGGRPGIAHGVTPSEATTRSPSSVSPVTRTSSAAAARRPPASTTKVPRSMASVDGRLAVVGRGATTAPVLPDGDGHRRVAGHLEAYDGPDRRLRPLADDVGQALHEVVGGVDGRRGVEVARHRRARGARPARASTRRAAGCAAAARSSSRSRRRLRARAPRRRWAGRPAAGCGARSSTRGSR